mmetsp:Transcript_23635/g.37165  ORF Transcript_23635/g.37165 Transcript_23635/m.37165 type:complete len:205 (-) Transcript_23635:3178-3792(-)
MTRSLPRAAGLYRAVRTAGEGAGTPSVCGKPQIAMIYLVRFIYRICATAGYALRTPRHVQREMGVRGIDHLSVLEARAYLENPSVPLPASVPADVYVATTDLAHRILLLVRKQTAAVVVQFDATMDPARPTTPRAQINPPIFVRTESRVRLISKILVHFGSLYVAPEEFALRLRSCATRVLFLNRIKLVPPSRSFVCLEEARNI